LLDGVETAPQTPLCSLLLAECIQQAGWPDGGLNVLPLSNDDASLLVTDERIKLISFTGSVPVGWDIKRRRRQEKSRAWNLAATPERSCTATPISPMPPTAA